MPFRICTIGCGSMAAYVHGPSYRKYASLRDDVVLAACCDLDGGRAETFRKTFGFARSYTDVNTMLEKETPDAVCLVVPERLTASLAVAVIERGVPLLTEKPPGLTAEETRRMLSAARRRAVPVRVAFNRRTMPLVDELRRRLAAHPDPSDIQHIRYDFYRVGRADADFSTTAIHGIDAARFLAGSDYASVRFRYQSVPGYSAEVVNIYMDCEFQSGASAFLSFCPATGILAERATVHAGNQSYFLQLPVAGSADGSGRLAQYSGGRLASESTGPDDLEHYVASGFYRENESFFDDVRAGTIQDGDLASALQSVELMECIRNRLPSYTHLSEGGREGHG